MSPASPSGWTFMADANVFVGYNDQRRKFTDAAAWESQNWFMLDGAHRVARGTLTLDGMMSLEPFTLAKLGSPQVFQTGETYHLAPLIDRQHPHDLVMGLGGTYSEDHDGFGYHLAAALVGSPALGPTPFMHRESARDNPQAPLVHHYTDSTHTTPGALTAGFDLRDVTVEASWFRGEEPDEDRLNLDRPRLDSWSARAGWHRGAWRAQFSGGRLHRPEAFEPFDLTRLTASIEYGGAIRGRPFAATALWGENREIHGILDGYLVEWDWAAWRNGSVYGRGETVAKDLLHLGPEVPGFLDFHPISHVNALTAGYVQDLVRSRLGRVGLGADATIYGVDRSLVEPYGSPHSFHVFVRYRADRAAHAAHLH